MEDDLTLDELYLLIDSDRKKEHRNNKFLAAVQGIDLDDDPQKDDAFERVKAKAAADLAGKTEQEMVFDYIGIEVESDD